MGAVTVPGLQRDECAHLLVNEAPGLLKSGIIAFHVANLEPLAALLDDSFERERLLEVDADRLFAKHVLAGLQCLDGSRYVERVRRRDYHRVECGIGQHLIIIGIGFLWRMGMRHALTQVVRDVADRVKPRVRCLGAAFEMPCLRDGAAAENTDIELRIHSTHALKRCAVPLI